MTMELSIEKKTALIIESIPNISKFKNGLAIHGQVYIPRDEEQERSVRSEKGLVELEEKELYDTISEISSRTAKSRGRNLSIYVCR